MSFQKFFVSLLNLFNHGIEATDEALHFSPGLRLRSHGEIFLVGDIIGGLGKVQDRTGDNTLEFEREQPRERGRYKKRDDCGSEPLVGLGSKG